MARDYVIEKSWTTQFGHEAVAIGLRDLGHRCGYVGMPYESVAFFVDNDKPIEEVTYDDFDINCHGGLTFSSGKVIWEDDDEERKFWIGFDCGHYNDARDLDLIENQNLKAIFSGSVMNSGTIKTMDYVVNECERISKQLNEYEKKYMDKKDRI